MPRSCFTTLGGFNEQFCSWARTANARTARFSGHPIGLIDADHVAAIRYEHSMLTLTSDVSVSECGAVFIDRRDPAALIDGMLHLGQIMAVRGGLCRLKGNTLMLFYR